MARGLLRAEAAVSSSTRALGIFRHSFPEKVTLGERVHPGRIAFLGRLGKPGSSPEQVGRLDATSARHHLPRNDHRFRLAEISGGNEPLERIVRVGLAEHLSEQHLRRDGIEGGSFLERLTQSGEIVGPHFGSTRTQAGSNHLHGFPWLLLLWKTGRDFRISCQGACEIILSLKLLCSGESLLIRGERGLRRCWRGRGLWS